MAEYELSVTPNYVKDWKVSDALREIFQNAQDQSSVNGIECYSTYDASSKTLTVVNPNSWLDRKTLLLGHTSKESNDGDRTQVGQFGEGYKLACLVLLREGKHVAIKNECYNEVWEPYLKSSRRYNGETVLIFAINGRLSYKHFKDKPLSFVITGITQDEWQAYQDLNLKLSPPAANSLISTYYGDILLEEKYQGKIHVGSLFVGTVEGMQYGYNIKPGYLQIDRDRRILPDFDTRWTTSKMWADSGSEKVLQLIEEDAPDVSYLDPSELAKGNIGSQAFQSFISKYGEHAYPVSGNNEMEALAQVAPDYKPIIVSSIMSKLLSASGSLPSFNLKQRTTFKGRLQIWMETVKDKLSEDEVSEFNKILEGMWM